MVTLVPLTLPSPQGLRRRLGRGRWQVECNLLNAPLNNSSRKVTITTEVQIGMSDWLTEILRKLKSLVNPNTISMEVRFLTGLRKTLQIFQ